MNRLRHDEALVELAKSCGAEYLVNSFVNKIEGNSVFIRNGKTMGWDIAAGIAILKTAGGSISKLDLKELKINKKSLARKR